MASRLPKLLVGIGSSAGGTSALEKFFKNNPSKEAAYFVVPHLSRDFASSLSEIIAKHCHLEVVKAEDGAEVQAGFVYVLQPNHNIFFDHMHIVLSEREQQEGLNFPIDTFFRSLALGTGKNAVGILLSGTGSDGTQGARVIKEMGGLVLAQSPSDAEFKGMPEAIISTGLVDTIATAEELPRFLNEYIRAKSSLRHARNSNLDEFPKPVRKALKLVQSMLLERKEIDTSKYRPEMIIRTMETLASKHQCTSSLEYLHSIEDEPDKIDALAERLFVGKTEFFRDARSLHKLRDLGFSDMMKNKVNSGELFKVWVAGCSTGEDAYSTAILALEEAEKVGLSPSQIKIFATDISQRSITQASRGFYSSGVEQEIPHKYLEKYFIPGEGGYKVNNTLRSVVNFCPHNLLWHPPFTKVDAIVCRNVLIYFILEEQKRLISLFSFSLNIGGFLLLGPSEASLEEPQLIPCEEGLRLYKKKANLEVSAAAKSQIFNSPLFKGKEPHRPPSLLPVRQVRKLKVGDWGQFADIFGKIVECAFESAILVDDENTVRYVYGKAHQHLRFAGGKFSKAILRMLPPKLSIVVEEGLNAVRRCDTAEEAKPVHIQLNSNTKGLEHSPSSLTFLRFEIKEPEQYFVLIIFNQQETKAVEKISSTTSVSEQELISSLETKLFHANESLHVAVEELKSTNEDLLNSNEELQSTNEELQSVNEELYSVNAEYQKKIEELKDLGQDMEHFFYLTDIGAIILDQDLKVRRFTPAATALVHLLPIDLGRKITDLSRHFLDENFVESLIKVRDGGKTQVSEIYDEDHNKYQMFIYSDPRKHTDQKNSKTSLEGQKQGPGVVITFTKLPAESPQLKGNKLGI